MFKLITILLVGFLALLVSLGCAGDTQPQEDATESPRSVAMGSPSPDLILYEEEIGIEQTGNLRATFQGGILDGVEINLSDIPYTGPDKNLLLTEIREGYYSGYSPESDVVVIIELPRPADG